MTISILTKLAALPSGIYADPLSFEELRLYLQRVYLTERERQRNARHVVRDQLYRDGGCEFMEGVIDCVFKDPAVRQLRKEWVEHTRFNNPVKRIVNEIATVYAEPATRNIADDTGETYARLLDVVQFDLEMFQISRLLNLHRALLVGFRVRQDADGQRGPVIDVATPATVRAVVSPIDPKLVLGWLIRTGYQAARSSADSPAWVLWTDHERLHLREDLSPITDTYVVHGIGACPWVPITLGPPCPGFWPGEEGEDLVAGHVSIWMSNILLLKEQKSATKQTVLSGDTTTMARDQASDSESVITAPDGTNVNTLDMSMDLSMFRDTADHVLDCLANNYGMSPAIVRHQGVQSADARDLMRIPLHEIRLYQQTPFRRFEERLIKVMALIVAVDLPEYTFDPSGFRIKFAESLTPMSKTEELAFFVAGRSAGVDDTIDYIMRQSPGLTSEEALLELEEHVSVETMRNMLMRPLQAISGSMGANVSPSPAQAVSPTHGTDPG